MATKLDTLLDYYMKLNEEGRKQTLEYMQTLTYVPRCTTREEREPAVVLTFKREGEPGRDRDRERRG